jgi:hypothetical protein
VDMYSDQRLKKLQKKNRLYWLKANFVPKEFSLRIACNVQENDVALIAILPNFGEPNPNTISSWFEKPTLGANEVIGANYTVTTPFLSHY